MRWLILVFIVIPALEMFTLIEVGQAVGSVLTVFMVFFTAIIGVVMLRAQGLSTLLSFNQKVKAGEVPAKELVSAGLLALAGVMLLVPGFVTDTLGFLLLIPFVRHLMADRIVARGVMTVTREFEESQVYAFFDENFRQGETYEARRRENATEQSYPDPEIPKLEDASADSSAADGTPHDEKT